MTDLALNPTTTTTTTTTTTPPPHTSASALAAPAGEEARVSAAAGATLAMWLFLASEVMFFVGVLAVYVVLRAGNPQVFHHHPKMLSLTPALVNTGLLLASSATLALAVRCARRDLARRGAIFLALTVALAAGFIAVKLLDYRDKLGRYTVLAREGSERSGKVFILDGVAKEHLVSVNGVVAMPAGTRFVTVRPGQKVGEFGEGRVAAVVSGPDGRPMLKFDEDDAAPDQLLAFEERQVADVERRELRTRSIHLVGHKRQVPRDEPISVRTYVPAMDSPEAARKRDDLGPVAGNVINDLVPYGPQKSPFFSCYYALTGLHALHVAGGAVAALLLILPALAGRALPVATGNLALYWFFVDAVWLVLFPLLYFT